MRFFVWILRGVVFFALFAFALNNRHEVTIHWLQGHHWTTPLVILVLGAFALGCAAGVLAMTPAWWRRRAVAARQAAAHGSRDASIVFPAGPERGRRADRLSDESELALSHPPRQTTT